jgi:hypothetical protein
MGTEGRAEGSSSTADGPRKIIHIDMDAFYASVEQRDNPELRGKPVAVGGSRERGVVAAASYEARQFGVRSAMPSITAKRKCPDLIFVKPRFDAYRAISLQIREIFAAYTPIIEPLSLDEAYLDVTENLKGIVSATQIAEEIRARSEPKPSSRLRPASPTTSSSPNWPRITASRTGSSSSLRRWGRNSWRPCQSGSFTASGLRRPPKCSDLGSRPASTSERRPWSSSSNISAKRVLTITGLRAASTSGRSAPIGYGNPSVQRTRLPPISSPTKLHVMRFERSSIRCGGNARALELAAAPSRSRSNSLISGRSREAAPVRCRSEREANSNSLAMPFSNLSFPSPKAFASSVSRCLRSRWKRLNASPNSGCPLRLGPTLSPCHQKSMRWIARMTRRVPLRLARACPTGKQRAPVGVRWRETSA